MKKKAKDNSERKSSSRSHFQVGELDASSDLLGFDFSKQGIALAVLAGLMGFALVALRTHLQNWLAAANGAVFAICLFWIYRSYLPTTLLVRVKDILRFRYAFLTLHLAGTLAVMASPAFLENYATVNRSSLCMTGAILCPLLVVLFFRTRSRLLLAATCFLCGGLCVTHPLGVVSFAGVLFTVFYVKVKCSEAFARMHSDETYGEAFNKRMRPVFSSLSIASRSLILCFFFFAAGACVLIAYHTNCSGSLVVDHMMQLAQTLTSGYLTKNFLFILATSLVLAVLANLCSRKASDITGAMTAPYVILYGCIGIFALLWPLGVIKYIPPFTSFSIGAVREQSLLPEIFVASAIVVSAAVFLVEICCRDESSAEYYDDDEVKRTSPLVRNVKAGAIACGLLATIAFAAYRAL